MNAAQTLAAAETMRRAAEGGWVERFWSRVDKSGDCWMWTGCTDRRGYGALKLNRKTLKAHRLALELATGKSADGFFVLHACHNPGCCRPAHLRRGTHIDNVRDMIEAGRGCVGVDRWNAKLTDEKVREMRSLRSVKRAVLAARYGVGERTIRKIISGKSWAHVHP